MEKIDTDCKRRISKIEAKLFNLHKLRLSSLTILVSSGFLTLSLFLFYLGELFFSCFLQLKSNFIRD